MKYIKLFENFNNLNIEEELKDIVIHFCEETNTEFELNSIYCNGDVYIWKIDDSKLIRSRNDYWDFYEMHKNLSLELGYHFHLSGVSSDFIIFSKYGDLKNTFIEILDWISSLELVINESPFENGYVTGKRIIYKYLYEGSRLIQWTKYINSEGLESLDPRKASFSNGKKESHYYASIYLNKELDNIFLQCYINQNGNGISIFKSWLIEIEPLFKFFKMDINKLGVQN